MESRSRIDLPQEIDDYIKETIDHSLGLPVSTKTLELKLQASEEARRNLQNQYFVIHSRLKEKDEALDRARSEASMNAQAIKRFVEENQRLAEKCASLMKECSRLEQEVGLYEHDREALMEFANESDERGKEAEVRLLEAENQLGVITEELQFYKKECDIHLVKNTKLNEELLLLRERNNVLEKLRLQGCSGNHLDCIHCASSKSDDQMECPCPPASTPEVLSQVGDTLEEDDLYSVITWVVNKDGLAEDAHAFLEAHSEVESCQRLLKMWDSLRPLTRNFVALLAAVETLQNDKEQLRLNLSKAEEEVKVLFEENNIMDEEIKRLLKLYNRERHHRRHGSGDKHTNSSSSKGNKRKSSPKICSPIEGLMDFDSPDSSRPPLSPLQHNTPDSRMQKK